MTRVLAVRTREGRILMRFLKLETFSQPASSILAPEEESGRGSCDFVNSRAKCNNLRTNYLDLNGRQKVISRDVFITLAPPLSRMKHWHCRANELIC